jgi:uncharacterized CHY-type Zn-finger protein
MRNNENYKRLREKISERALFCVKCEELLSFSARYDATFCKVCNEWREKACNAPDCESCLNRPLRPIKEKG